MQSDRNSRFTAQRPGLMRSRGVVMEILILKNAVRNYLKNSPYVAKFRAGEEGEGGDGVSIVDIN